MWECFSCISLVAKDRRVTGIIKLRFNKYIVLHTLISTSKYTDKIIITDSIFTFKSKNYILFIWFVLLLFFLVQFPSFHLSLIIGCAELFFKTLLTSSMWHRCSLTCLNIDLSWCIDPMYTAYSPLSPTYSHPLKCTLLGCFSCISVGVKDRCISWRTSLM